VLNITVRVFGLGRSYTNVKSGKSPENVWKRSWKCLQTYFQNCVGTLLIQQLQTICPGLSLLYILSDFMVVYFVPTLPGNKNH